MDDKKKIIDENKKDRSIMFAGIAIIIQILWFIMRKDINLGLIGFV